MISVVQGSVFFSEPPHAARACWRSLQLETSSGVAGNRRPGVLTDLGDTGQTYLNSADMHISWSKIKETAGVVLHQDRTLHASRWLALSDLKSCPNAQGMLGSRSCCRIGTIPADPEPVALPLQQPPLSLDGCGLPFPSLCVLARSTDTRWQ